MNKPTIGRIVLVALSAAMCEQINRRRTNGNSIKERMDEGNWPAGAQAHIGNEVTEGEVFPMVITKVWSEDCVNGQVLLDGNDTFWGLSLQQGDEPGKWSWPKREE